MNPQDEHCTFVLENWGWKTLQATSFHLSDVPLLTFCALFVARRERGWVLLEEKGFKVTSFLENAAINKPCEVFWQCSNQSKRTYSGKWICLVFAILVFFVMRLEDLSYHSKLICARVNMRVECHIWQQFYCTKVPSSVSVYGRFWISYGLWVPEKEAVQSSLGGAHCPRRKKQK